VGPAGFELNTRMKLTLTPQRLSANRSNAPLGGAAYAKKCADLYQANPAHCGHCQIQLPQAKRNNKFCSRSCSATHSNAAVKGTLRYERPPCRQCSKPTGSRKSLYCSKTCSAEGKRLYLTAEEASAQRKKRSREISANYRARVQAQTPQDADRAAMREFYLACPEGYEVDHIVPISRGGPHSLENLQYLTISENRRKSNKLL
jgi:hypothetical protein